MGREVSNLWQQLTEMEKQLCAKPESDNHEETEQHRVFCDERFCVERGPLFEDCCKAA